MHKKQKLIKSTIIKESRVKILKIYNPSSVCKHIKIIVLRMRNPIVNNSLYIIIIIYINYMTLPYKNIIILFPIKLLGTKCNVIDGINLEKLGAMIFLCNNN